MLRSDSVIVPDRRAVSRTIDRCTALIFWLSSPVSPPRTTTPIPNTGISSQFLVTPYQTTKPIPTTDE